MHSRKICGHGDSEANTSHHFSGLEQKLIIEKTMGEQSLSRKGVRRAGCDEFLFISLATMAGLNCLQYVLSPATDEQYQFGQTLQIFFSSPMKYFCLLIFKYFP